jgi:hypothetical protein
MCTSSQGLLEQGKAEYAAAKRERIELRGGYDSDDETQFVSYRRPEETVESERSEVVND